MKKWIIILIAVVCVCACVGLIVLFATSDSGASNQLFGKGLKASDLVIGDFDWAMEKTRINGKECYAMSLTNNSKYDVIGVQIRYKVRDDATEEQLKVFDDFMKDHEDWIDEDETTKDITLIGGCNKLVKKGDTINKIVVAIGMDNLYWYDRPDETQFNLMEPETMEIGVIGEDNRLYIAYYDFEDEPWVLDEESKELNTWYKNELSNKTPKPTSDYYVVTSDEDDETVSFIVYDVTKEDFKGYVETVKTAGYTVDAPENYTISYMAEDNDGNNISIWYYDDEARMSVKVTNY